MIHFQIRRGGLEVRTRQSLERGAYVCVDDLNAVHEDLTRRGAKIALPPTTAPFGIRELVVEDVNGHRIAFGEVQ